MNKQETKQTLLDIGTELISRQGYNHTGLNEVLETAGIPKGSFYYYFDSKEDFALQVLDAFLTKARTKMESYLTDESLPPLARLRAYFEWYISYLESVQCSVGCMAGNLGQELADQNETFRLKIDQIMNGFSGAVANCLKAAQQYGEIDSRLDAEDLAAFCYNSWQGALLRMKVTKSPTPLQTFIHTFFDVILK